MILLIFNIFFIARALDLIFSLHFIFFPPHDYCQNRRRHLELLETKRKIVWPFFLSAGGKRGAFYFRKSRDSEHQRHLQPSVRTLSEEYGVISENKTELLAAFVSLLFSPFLSVDCLRKI